MQDELDGEAMAVIGRLGLRPLDREGGYFRRTTEATAWVRDGAEAGGAGPAEAERARRAYSVIYALLTPAGFSALHRLRRDEIWCWHAGDGLESLRLHPGGDGEWVRLGVDLAAGDQPQDVVRAGVWQGTRLRPGGRWALVSCVVAPEFRWEDFELGERAALTAAYPEFGDAILALTRTDVSRGER